ncbi:unnamed protein product [Arctogadus glacialis]
MLERGDTVYPKERGRALQEPRGHRNENAGPQCQRGAPLKTSGDTACETEEIGGPQGRSGPQTREGALESHRATV